MSIEDKVDKLVDDVGYIRAKIEIIEDHETRLRVLERFRSAVPSVAVLGLLMAVIGLFVR